MTDNQFTQYEIPEATERPGNIMPIPGGSVVRDGTFQSPNFAKGFRGWRVDSEGNAEFNDGTFRGTFDVGGTTITIEPGDDIQFFLNKIEGEGGGRLYLQSGTYTLTSDLSIPGGVVLEGVSRDNVIIDCNTSYSVTMSGTDAYSTGTVSISNGGTTVTGSGTTWTAAMVGQYIYLGGLWYEIASRASDTSIDITEAYGGTDLSGAGYAIATVNFNPILKRVTIQNSSGSGLELAYNQEPLIDDIYVVDCGIGMDFDFSVYPRLIVTSQSNGTNIDMNYVNGFYIDFSDLSLSTTGDGITMANCIDSTLFNTFIGDCADNGISMTNCSGITLLANAIDGNTNHGIEMVSGNDGNQLLSNSTDDNGGDGIKLTATTDNTLISTSLMNGNGGYGLNIAASTCNLTSVSANTFSGNSSGTYTDSGTDSSIRNNAGANNNKGEYAIFGSSNISGTVSDATSYYFGNTIFVLSTNESSHRIRVPKKGVITAASVTFINLSGGTLGSNETSSIYIRLNNTTDTLISNAVQNDTAALTPFYVSNENLSIDVDAGDYFVIKWTTPTWATNPASIGFQALVFIE